MTTGTVHTFDPARGTGTLCCIAGTLVPFSSAHPALAEGDRVTFRLTGGICGLYATEVELAAQPQRQMVISSSAFRVMSGTLASAAG